jgi:hypothetical protein
MRRLPGLGQQFVQCGKDELTCGPDDMAITDNSHWYYVRMDGNHSHTSASRFGKRSSSIG